MMIRWLVLQARTNFIAGAMGATGWIGCTETRNDVLVVRMVSQNLKYQRTHSEQKPLRSISAESKILSRQKYRSPRFFPSYRKATVDTPSVHPSPNATPIVQRSRYSIHPGLSPPAFLTTIAKLVMIHFRPPCS